MKRLSFMFVGMLLTIGLGAQTLEEIAKKSFDASKQGAYEKVQTVTIVMKAYQSGMEMPMTMQMKKPDKIRVSVSFQGMEIVQTFDGTKGYMMNPMTGSSDAIEMPPSDAAKIKDQSNFNSPIMQYLKEGRLEMAGDATVSGKPAWKIKANLPSGDVSHLYIDKSSFLQVKQDAIVSQAGVDMTVETYMTDYTDFGGLFFPKTITSYANGAELMVMMIEKVEIDKPMDDSLFTLKK